MKPKCENACDADKLTAMLKRTERLRVLFCWTLILCGLIFTGTASILVSKFVDFSLTKSVCSNQTELFSLLPTSDPKQYVLCAFTRVLASLECREGETFNGCHCTDDETLRCPFEYPRTTPTEDPNPDKSVWPTEENNDVR